MPRSEVTPPARSSAMTGARRAASGANGGCLPASGRDGNGDASSVVPLQRQPLQKPRDLHRVPMEAACRRRDVTLKSDRNRNS
jgi:hypothetical protein